MPAHKRRKTAKPRGVESEASPPHSRSREERIAAGKALRDRRAASEVHAGWKLAAQRRDPIDVLEQSNRDRMPELIPIRYGRMLRSPFTFLRGSAA